MIKTSVLILTHNAPKYVEETLRTLNEVTSAEDRRRFEVIVLDNASDEETRLVLSEMEGKGYIDKLKFSDENTFFAKGNNLAAELAESSSKYYLLLNSDVSIKDPEWLRRLREYKDEGCHAAAAYGMCSGPERADGYCFLIDKAVYDEFMLDETFQWWGAVTKLQCEMLDAGHSILAIDNHDDIIYHYGGKSGRDFKKAKQVNIDTSEVMACFERHRGRLVVVDHSPLRTLGIVKKKFKKLSSRIKRS